MPWHSVPYLINTVPVAACLSKLDIFELLFFQLQYLKLFSVNLMVHILGNGNLVYPITSFSFKLFLVFVVVVVLEFEPRTLVLLGRYSTT
jgi:hypothetical protein